MPGSLDDLDFTIDDEDVHREDQEHYEDGEYDDDGVDEYDDGLYGELSEEIAMDEDLLAATEMKKIPFLWTWNSNWNVFIISCKGDFRTHRHRISKDYLKYNH